jgi:hypothetical protein
MIGSSLLQNKVYVGLGPAMMQVRDLVSVLFGE